MDRQNAAETEVLIVGAGPTGLVLALFLTKLGVRVRIIDKTDGPGTTTRAVVMHARNLEFYQQVGIADKCIEGGLNFAAVNMWVDGRHAAHVKFDDLGEPLSKFSFVLMFPQDAQEKMLGEELAQLGVNVERRTDLISFECPDGGVSARLRNSDGSESVCKAAFIAGCDGGRSTVREELGIGFPGGDYSDVFYVADVEATGPAMNGEVNVAFDDADFLIVFPLKEAGVGRLVGVVTGGAGKQRDEVKWEDVSTRVMEHLKLEVRKVRWFSTYHVHHRVASAFRSGPAFLLGDAAHIHSPVGGQGMNTGIGDAVNLAWKIAGVLQRRIDPAVLDTYETERIAFAETLVETTDRVFEFVTKRGPIAKHVRLDVVPTVFPRLFAMRPIRRAFFRMLSQLAIQYPDSWLSAGHAGHVRGGDRLPWIEWIGEDGTRHDNYQFFTSLDWQLHWYGELPPAVHDSCETLGLTVYEFPWRPQFKDAGLLRNAMYLMRPDEHIALAHPTADVAVLEQYLTKIGYAPRPVAAATA
ncbi:MAG TPA: FAD-dependent monooxygenase [Gemmatimonadaceae bacterium]|jgi:2-polyprenyl-6-methoxyphenol hydroxylase-like FAD-dependent oxidoreductase|nr:FAD-dependent monooxygenase [Gemmatimonadaceae bacterium]